MARLGRWPQRHAPPLRGSIPLGSASGKRPPRSHRPPGPAARWGYPNVTYVLDGVRSAMAQAVAAAGDRNVYVQGGYTAQKAIEEGVLDEIQVHVMPVLLGDGHRLFDTLPAEVELEILRVIDTPHATHIRYRIRKGQ